MENSHTSSPNNQDSDPLHLEHLEHLDLNNHGKIDSSKADTSKVNTVLDYKIINSQERHCKAISNVIKLAHGDDIDDLHISFPEEEQVLEQINRHPKGHFVAVATIDNQEVVLGTAVTMRSHYSPDYEPLPWLEMIGSVEIPKHNPEGEWLYGVECSVHPDYQGKGIGSALYRARFDYVCQANLKGMYACGMLKGYDNYRTQYTQKEYGELVIAGDIIDPTVSVQMKNGFKAKAVVQSYEVDFTAGNAAMLIVWESPEYECANTVETKKNHDGDSDKK